MNERLRGIARRAALKIVDEWDEWDAEGGQRAQAEQDMEEHEFVLIHRVEAVIEAALDEAVGN